MIQTQPFFSIIIPVYNAEKYIVRAVNSVLEQIYKNFELILIDDGSIDSSKKNVEEYISKYNNIHYFYQENSGVSAARNKGISVSKGQYVLFVDADDIVSDDLLQKVYESLSADNLNTDILFFGKKEVSNTGKVLAIKAPNNWSASRITGAFFKEMLVRNLLPTTWNKAVRSDFIGDSKFKNIRVGEDYQFYLDLLDKNPKVSAISDPLYSYFVESEGSVFKSYDPNRTKLLSEQASMVSILSEKYVDDSKERRFINSFHNAYVTNQVITNIYRHDNNSSMNKKYLELKGFVEEHPYKIRELKSYFSQRIIFKLRLVKQINYFKFSVLNLLYKIKG